MEEELAVRAMVEYIGRDFGIEYEDDVGGQGEKEKHAEITDCIG